MQIFVDNEISKLKSLLVHFPDEGLGRVVPHKAQDWLFEDIVDYTIIVQKEYNYYILLLLYFLDPEKVKGKIDQCLENENFFNPHHKDFHNSKKVLEIEKLLSDVLENPDLREEMTASIASYEEVTYLTTQELKNYSASELAKTFISGISKSNQQIFPPIPNFIFSRDISITIHNYLVLNKPAKLARQREAILMKYIFYNHPFFQTIKKNIIEIDNNYASVFYNNLEIDISITLEGGDLMLVHPKHLLIGISERTSELAAQELANSLFYKKIVDKITLIKIPKKRDFMHIDTIFTQVKKDVWVLYGLFKSKIKSKDNKYFNTNKNFFESETEVVQYQSSGKKQEFDSIESLLIDISMNDFACQVQPKIIYSGNDEYPFSAREQWTDSCNLLALKEGVVLGYDRNYKTIETFKKLGFACITVQQLLAKLEQGECTVESIENTFITMPSAELSRARGGFHCMSMPLEREKTNV